MPSDLVTMKKEKDAFTSDETKTTFKNISLHLMPISRNAFYTREDNIDSQPESARSNKANDFYKGVEITKVAPKEEVKQNDAISITVQGLTEEEKNKLLDKKSEEKKNIEKEAKDAYNPPQAPPVVARTRNVPNQPSQSSQSSAESYESGTQSYDSEDPSTP